MGKVLFINNRDSFIYILVDYVAQQGFKVVVTPNTVTLDEVEAINPDKLIVSPGPGHPARDTGNTIPLVRRLAAEGVPVLGVCLGHQAVIHAYGGAVDHSPSGPKHGKISLIRHDGKTIFRGVPNPFKATRYHSLAAVERLIPPCLEVSAKAEDGTVMGIRHRELPVEGVQFHPESVLTRVGMRIVKNFLRQG